MIDDLLRGFREQLETAEGMGLLATLTPMLVFLPTAEEGSVATDAAGNVTVSPPPATMSGSVLPIGG